MCQLLGMNGNTPTDIVFSFTGFCTRAEEHKDGFGIAFFEGNGVRLFVDAQSARNSPVADMVRRYPIRSDNIIAHIRKATQGRVALENTHPFRPAQLQDDDIRVDFAELTTPQDRVAVVVTEPLTRDEEWIRFAPGELKVFAGGAPLVEES